jgi:hypothetical protein
MKTITYGLFHQDDIMESESNAAMFPNVNHSIRENRSNFFGGLPNFRININSLDS